MQRLFFKQRKQSLGSSHGNQLSHSRIILGTDFKEERPLGAKRFPEAAPPPIPPALSPPQTSPARPRPLVVRKSWPSPARFSRHDRPIDVASAQPARKKKPREKNARQFRANFQTAFFGDCYKALIPFFDFVSGVFSMTCAQAKPNPALQVQLLWTHLESFLVEIVLMKLYNPWLWRSGCDSWKKPLRQKHEETLLSSWSNLVCLIASYFCWSQIPLTKLAIGQLEV